MEFKGPQGIVSFQGDDVIMVPDEGRVLVGRSEEIAGGLVSASDEFSQEATLHFRNESEDSRLVFWINGEGRPKLGGSVQPGEAFSIQTSMGHKWVITDLEGVRIGDLEPIHAGQDEDIILK